MKEKAKAILLVVISPKALILGVAVFNFIGLWKASEDMPGLCSFCPWYSSWSFTNEPTRLLLAACGLCLSVRWSYLAAIGLSGFTLLEGATWYYRLLHEGMFLASWSGNPTLHTQYLLASIIFVYAAACFSKSVLRRDSARSGI